MIASRPHTLSRAIRWWLIAGIICVVMIAVHLTLALHHTPHVFPVGDGAAMEMSTLHTLNGPWPLGPYSRFGWTHPGPLYFYVLAPFYALAGRHSLALNLGALSANLLWLLAIAWVVARHRRPSLALALGLVLTLFIWRASDLLASAWNPHVVVLPCAALIVLAAAVARGDSVLLPALALAASFVAQTHVGLLPFAGVVAVAAAVAWAAGWSSRQIAENRRWILATAGVLGLVWMLPLYEEWTREPGNLKKLVRFFAHGGGGPTRAWTDAFQVWSDMLTAPFRSGFSIPFGHNARSGTSPLLVGIAALEVCALALGAWFAWTKDKLFTWFSTFCVVASLIALLAVAQIRGDITDHAVFWISIVGTMNVAALLTSCLSRCGRHGAVPFVGMRLSMLTLATALSVPVLTAMVLGISHFQHGQVTVPRAPENALIAELADTVADTLRRANVQRSRISIDASSWGPAVGIVLQLYKRGLSIGVDREFEFMVGRLVVRGDEDFAFSIVNSALASGLLKRYGGCILIERENIAIYVPALSARAAGDACLPFRPMPGL